jgi:hypothetical protein
VGNTKLLIRSQLVKDALTFVLVAEGFSILSETAPCDESTVVVIEHAVVAVTPRAGLH